MRRRWVLNYEQAEPRLKPCPRCDGEGYFIRAFATREEPEDSEACEECGGSGTVYRRVNVYRKRKHLNAA
jgi:hypothetical protein